MDDEPEKKPKRIGIERGATRLEVIRLLAAGELSQTEIARRFDCDQSTVSYFAKRHRLRIEQVRDKLDDDWAGMWIADKKARLEIYQQNVEDLAKIIEASDDDPAIVKAQVATLFRAQQAAVRSAAEELGQLPTRSEVKVQTNPIVYRIEGVNPEDLK